MMIKLTEHIMNTQSIKIEDLPEGWRAIAFRKPKRGEHYIKSYGYMEIGRATVSAEPRLIIEKIQPRRIVLEETDRYHDPEDKSTWLEQVFCTSGEAMVKIIDYKVWREVKNPPRRIVLEETDVTCSYETTQEFKISNNSLSGWTTKILGEVHESE